ncbi:MAG: hypothetical protein WA581_03130 [Candidatus Acidiferrales bacterium]
MAGYLAEVAEVRSTLDSRYDEIKSGGVKPVDGEAYFEGLRQREDELLEAALAQMTTGTGVRPSPWRRARYDRHLERAIRCP